MPRHQHALPVPVRAWTMAAARMRTCALAFLLAWGAGVLCGVDNQARGGDAPLFIEEDGVVVVEVEAVEPGTWKRETGMDGYTGQCYYTWPGESINHSGSAGPLVYRIRILTPGTYQMRIRNRHDFHDSTEQNDCFTKLNEGASVKTFSYKRGEWNWISQHEHSHSKKIPASYDLEAGDHTFTIYGRSGGFSIDRFALFLKDKEKAALDPGRAPTTGGPQLPDLTPLKSVARYMEKQQFGRALAAAEREAAKDPAKDAEAVALAKEVVEAFKAHGARQQASLAALRPTDPLSAAEGLELVAEQYSGSDLGKEMAKTAKAWADDPAAKAEAKARRYLEPIEETVAELRKSRIKPDDRGYEKRYKRELRRIQKALDKLAEGYPDSHAYKKAQSLTKGIGLPEE